MLTDIQCKNAGPGRLSDGEGLYLLIAANGVKGWRFDYRIHGKRKTISFGPYPRVSLRAAREKCEEARNRVSRDIDPSGLRQVEKRERAQAKTFQEVAEEFWEAKGKFTNEGRLVSKRTADRNMQLLRHLYTMIGRRPIVEVTVPELHHGLANLHKSGIGQTAARCRAMASRIFIYAMATGKCPTDPAHGLSKAMVTPKGKPRPALVEADDASRLFRDIASYSTAHGGSPITQWGLQFLALTMVRPGEMRKAEWSEIDFDAAHWIIPAEKMKMRRPHAVPLSRQALAILRNVQEFNRERYANERRFVFSLWKDAPQSDATYNKALRTLGYDTKTEHCSHGFRSTASTLLNDELTWPPDVIEVALAHLDSSMRGKYNRAMLWRHWEARVKLLQHWADRLDLMCDAAQVVAMRRPERSASLTANELLQSVRPIQKRSVIAGPE